jgi:hypothetical protein
VSIRIAVTGRRGQIARALSEVGPFLKVEIIHLGLPEFDLGTPETVGPMFRGSIAASSLACTELHYHPGAIRLEFVSSA